MEVVHRACAVCGSNRREEVFSQRYASIAGLGDIDYHQRVLLCDECGFCFVSPTPTDAELGRYYATCSNYENPARDGHASSEMRSKWERTVGQVEARFSPGFAGRALEIGCATATGLDAFKSRGWHVLGIDPSARATELAREIYGIEVLTGVFDPALVAEHAPFDLIMLSHVVEHLNRPEELLRECAPLLSAEGVIYVEVPNLLRPLVPMGYFMFEHLNYFTPATLTRLMYACGFADASVELFENSPEIEPFYPVIAATFRASGERPAVASDRDAAREAVRGYVESTGAAIDGLERRIERIRADIAPDRLAVWGAGLHTAQLIALTGVGEAGIACIIDNDAKKHGERLCGIEIRGLGDPGELAREVDAILISSRASEREIYAQIAYLEQLGIRIYTLYS